MKFPASLSTSPKTMIPLNPQALNASSESSSHGSYPSDKEIAFLAFEFWKKEGCPHLRPEHWLNAERELAQAYARQNMFVPAAHEDIEEFWERETETVSGFNEHNAFHFLVKGNT